MNRTFSYSVASVSWINSAADLPEVDAAGYISETVQKSVLINNIGYRFCNFLDVFIEVAPSGHIVRSGFYRDSGLYKAPSFGNIPSHAFEPTKIQTPHGDGVIFRQTTGARTVSPEEIGRRAGSVLGAGVGYIVGSPEAGEQAGSAFGRTVAHQIRGFPPIWSILEISISSNGDIKQKLVQHSLFPSLTYYVQKEPSNAPGQLFSKTFSYDATKSKELPAWEDNGWGPIHSVSGPSGGNPWGITKGVFGGAENDPSY